MKLRKTIIASAFASALMLAQFTAQGGTTAVGLGSGAPPASLGSYTLTAFPADAANPVYPASWADVTSVAGPGGAVLNFNQALTHDIAGDINTGWETWSHGYAGDVYDTIASADPYSVTLTLSKPAYAFYLYGEPTSFGPYDLTAAVDGVSIVASVSGNSGAYGFGFYTDTTPFDTIMVSSVGGLTDFAIGEFGVAFSPIPEPTTVIAGLLLTLPLAFQGIRTWRNRNAHG